ncbi:MAG TPA: hypothetical protein PLZ51_23385 [Aggregatilineales bacterium]|nr:hypothetical protein [Aggregatilineales bacterium]
MSDHTITLNLPQHLYERLYELAQTNQRPIESVVIERLSLGLDDIPDQSIFDDMPDDQLWEIVYQPFQMEKDERLQALTQLGKKGQLSDAHEIELEQLMESFRKYILRRSKALLALKEHGVDVEAQLQEHE